MLVAVNATSSHPEYSIHRDRYLQRLLRAAIAIQDEVRFVVLVSEASAAMYGGFECQIVGGSGGKAGFMGLGGSGDVNKAVKKLKADAVLSPLQGAQEKVSVPELLFVHDLGPWEEEAAKGGVGAVDKGVKRTCAQAKSFFMPTEHLRRRCLDLFEVPLNKGMVAAPGLDPIFRTTQDTMVDLPYVVLYMSPLVAPCLAKVLAVREQLEKELPHTIVIAGPGLAGEPVDWGGRVVRIEYLPDNHLAGLYQHGSAFIYPGLHDGAGYAVLEAMGAGSPVVAAKSGALQEVAKDIPIYYNPKSGDSMVQGIRRVLGFSKAERAQRVHLGQSATSNYTWEKSAWKLMSALQRL